MKPKYGIERNKHFSLSLKRSWCRFLAFETCKINTFFKLYFNKKVLLRERKRHTARHVASARYVGGGVTPSSHGGYPPPSRPGQGTPHHPDLARVTPHHPDLARIPPPSRPGWGTPHPRPGMGYPSHHQDLIGVPPTIKNWPGYSPNHPDLAGVPPTPDLGWGIPHPRPGMGYPPRQVWTDTQTRVKT